MVARPACCSRRKGTRCLGRIPEPPRHNAEVQTHARDHAGVRDGIVPAAVAPPPERMPEITLKGGKVATTGEALSEEAVGVGHRRQRQPEVQLLRHVAVLTVAVRHSRHMRRGHDNAQHRRRLHHSL
eukprot:CAMPEP_0171081776 /NCGR_PEP_ID=MMETSP0766_2-20121228/16717_1 /TAXON_ID=439317 /ORGANISM="Gambierdiscus australes, Strain CAWD 149" /LENGTH=126 /DNA_ID=CAMNT_0011539105 /DNA_START=86 /DNA_END=463 /DNA_ORIENTATION=-